MENRRGFIGRVVAGVAALFGLSQAAKASVPESNWLAAKLARLRTFGAEPLVADDHIFLYTQRHKFSICNKPSYLGCIMINRYRYPGEDWARGRDLADGPNTEATWNKILADIVAVEMVHCGRDSICTDEPGCFAD